MKKNYIKHLLGVFVGSFALWACGESEPLPSVENGTQHITIVVESVGESTGNPTPKPEPQSRRPISSVTPTQTFDKLALIILDIETTQVVYKTELNNWSNTNNITSSPYVDGKERGRKAVLELSGTDRLQDGKNYMIYAIGYQTGSFGNYVPFKEVRVGSKFNKTEVVRVPDGGIPEEIFAGSEYLEVKDGKVLSQTSSAVALSDAVVILRRQLSGTFGYFTNIRTTYLIEGQVYTAARLRLVASRANHSAIMGGFRSVEDPTNFNQENVINGYNPCTDYDAELVHKDGRITKSAFVKYEIDLSKWFPGPEEGVPFDQNGDGRLNGQDINWRVDEERYPDNMIKLKKGSVFGDCFMIAAAMHEEDIRSGLPTFQFQVLDKHGKILTYRDVYLREQSLLDRTRTIVSLPEGETGRTVITTETNPETEYCYSIVRNHLYSMGEKNHGQSYGEDKPIDLAKAEYLVLDVDSEWEAGGSIIFN